METILYLAHTQSDGTLPKAALETLSGCLEFSKGIDGASLVVGLVGEKIQGAADGIAGCGAARFIGVEGSEFAISRYASDRGAIEALVRASDATMIVAPATSRFSRVIPGVTHRLKGCIDSRITGMEVQGDQIQLQRWYYRQRIVASLTRSERPWFLLIESGVFQPWEGKKGKTSVEVLQVQVGEAVKKTKVIGTQSASSDATTIRPDADLLFVAGAGWTKKQSDGQCHVKEAESLIMAFLDKTQSSLGSSKSLVDQSSEGEAVLPFMTHLNQVGQTGSTPRHPKGLASCCHGEEPHAVGWRFINERRAINLDPNCGWAHGKADVLYVADAFRVLAKVNELLEKEKLVSGPKA